MIRYLYDMFFFASIILFVYLIIRLILLKKVKFHFVNDTLRTAFVIYIAAFGFIVLVHGRIPADYILYNFIPFHTIIEYLSGGQLINALKNIVGNIIITMPLGFFTFFNVRLFHGINIFIYSVCISVSVELVQFLIYLLGLGTRSIDIDDVILNSFGIIMGYFLTRFASKKIHNKKNGEISKLVN